MQNPIRDASRSTQPNPRSPLPFRKEYNMQRPVSVCLHLTLSQLLNNIQNSEQTVKLEIHITADQLKDLLRNDTLLTSPAAMHVLSQTTIDELLSMAERLEEEIELRKQLQRTLADERQKQSNVSPMPDAM